MDKEEKANVVISIDKAACSQDTVNMDNKEKAKVVIFIVGTAACSQSEYGQSKLTEYIQIKSLC